MRNRGLFLVAASIAAAGAALGAGRWTPGIYTDDFEDAGGLDYVQAVVVDPATTTLRIPAAWTWVQPGPKSDTSTDTLWSAPGSATDFVQVVQTGTSSQSLQLFQRFFPAVTDMEWDNDCASHRSTDTKCLLYPVSSFGEEAALGARSSQVLLVPDVSRFNDCQTSMSCRGSGDYTIASLTLYQVYNRGLFLPGRSYNATWWIRSPGTIPGPPPAPGASNDRLVGFEISFTSTVAGVMRTDYLGGANGGCTDLGIGTCLDRSRGCPVHVRLADPPEAGTATLYLNDPGDPAKSPYTPYSFSFSVGSLAAAPDPWHASDCAAGPADGMNVALCHEPPGGSWTFTVNTAGTSGAGSTAGSSCGTPPIPCTNSRAYAPAYVDGLAVTAGEGAYLSPSFDSLSPRTRWTRISWAAGLNHDAGGVRTPVRFDWRIADNTGGFAPSSTAFDGGVSPTAETDSLALGSPLGRHFQYRAALTSWDRNAANPPPTATVDQHCLRYSMGHDGSLTPRVLRFSAEYQPDAGVAITKPIAPARLRSWERLDFVRDEGGGGSVVCDVLDAAGNVLLSGVSSGASLAGIDPGRAPALRIRFTIDRLGTSSAPAVSSVRIAYRELAGRLALDRNVARLSRREAVAARFLTTRDGVVDLTVHDAAGQAVRVLFHGEAKAGDVLQRSWDGLSGKGVPVAPGLYFVTVSTPKGRETAKVAISR